MLFRDDNQLHKRPQYSMDKSNYSVRIKCTIPSTDEAAARNVYIAFQDAISRDLLSFCNSMSEPMFVKQAYEFTVEVKPLYGSSALFNLMQTFFLTVKQYFRASIAFRRDCMPVIFIASPLFFDDAPIPDHANIPVQSVYFGNIINSGTFGVHWTLEFYRLNTIGKRDRDLEKIKVNFEHDRGSVSIQFDTRERSRESNVVQTVEFTIKFHLNAIRRIIVDPLSIDKNSGGGEIKYKFRFHFELNCPPEIHSFILKGDKDQKRFGDGNRLPRLGRGWGPVGDLNSVPPHTKCVAECAVVSLEFNESMAVDTLFQIVSRLRVRSAVPVEFACMDLINMHIGNKKQGNPYVMSPVLPFYDDEPLNPAYLQRIKDAAPDPPSTKHGRHEVYADQFSLRYMIEAFLSRGAKVKDQLLVSVSAWTMFLDTVCAQYKKDNKKTLAVMENVLNRVDEMTFPKISIFRIMLAEFAAYDEMKKLNDAQMGTEGRFGSMEREGYVKVRKIVITPTRMIYIAPEQIMGNRVLRKHYATQTEILRVTFRDDDAQPLRPNTAGEKLTEKTVKKALTDGIIVGGRNFRFLGSSNSQMRDNGCYFAYDKEDTYSPPDRNGKRVWRPSERIADIRRRMGRLDELTNVAKFMARMGQCFTQSRAVSTGLPRNTSNFVFDIAGGNSEQNGDEMYTFSDGVGQISVEYLKKITKDLNLRHHPSVIQFRYRGYKGVLSLHPQLDDVNELRKKLEYIIEVETGEGDKKKIEVISTVKDENGDNFKKLNCRFRHSQMKFHAEPSAFEVVKFSVPTPVCLNKPFINILDQVTEMQSRESHLRLCDRVEELLHRQLRMISETLVREKSCRDKLKELPRRVSIDTLSQHNGFSLVTEPFFRSLIKASVRFMIKKQLNKEQIQIPLDLGRSMFGVVDETGLLQYGQIFVQYHANTKSIRASSTKIVRQGPTLITKNPCISAGDVRMFEAVDIPALRHLVDVVVFPQHGPRPHPDEMAGSDLDGDEYSVIWDPKLFFDRNEQAMIFPKGASQAAKLDMSKLDEDIRDFFVKYVTQDSVGMIANAHLNNSDLWGLESKVAKELAYKHSQAVDFPKTSVAPLPLTKEWDEIEPTEDTPGESIPPQRALRKPDFMQSNRDPVYASSRLIGRVYREISNVDNVLAISEEMDQQEEVKMDVMIHEEGWERYKDVALAQMTVYNNEIKTLLERYGIASESELMSGCMISIRNAISDREADDMSFFNTNQVIETQVTAIVRAHRESFIKEFGEIKKLTKVSSEWKYASDETENVFEREVYSPSVAMRQKAVALYKVTYDFVSKQNDSSPRLLSYPWIAYDVLAIVRGENQRKQTDFVAGLDAVNEMLTTQVLQYARTNQREMREKIGSWTGDDGRGNGVEAIQRYLSYYDGLGELAFFFVKWAEKEKVLARGFKEIHIILLVIQFCLGCYDELEAVITPIERKNTPSLASRVYITEPGRVVLNFLRWASSRSFKRMSSMSFDKPDLGVEGCFLRGEWMPMQMAATKSFYDLIFSLRFDLPSEGGHIVDPPSAIREMNPFVFELPNKVSLWEVENEIRRKTGASAVRLRRLETGEKTKVVISATGSLQSHAKIRHLLILPLNIKTSSNAKDMSNQFPDFIYSKIMDGVRAGWL